MRRRIAVHCRPLCAALAALGLLASGSALSQSPESASPPREVNITQGSDPEWIPSIALEREAVAIWQLYHAAVDEGRWDDAWAMLGKGLKADWPASQFAADKAALRDEYGEVLSRDRIRITWTKDSPAAPAAGIYVAIDASARFERAKRHRGYTILYQAPGESGFVVTRVEDTVMGEAAYDQSAAANSPLGAALVWRAVSKVCPNYTPPPLPEAKPDTLGEGLPAGSVADLRAAVEAREGLEEREENGWRVLIDDAAMSAWSFSPANSPFHPSVIRRMIENVPGEGARMRMAMRCEADKALCDALYTEMAARNGLIPLGVSEPGQIGD